MKKNSFLILLVATVAIFSAAIALAVPLSDNSENVREVYVQPTEAYPDLWKKVTQFEKKGLPKSARQVVDTIYVKAKAEQNAPQMCKAIIHQMKYITMIEDEALVKVIQKVQMEVDSAEYPVKPMLQSLLGEMYWSYYQQNLYTIQNRTETVEFKNDDLATWDLRKLVTESMNLLLASIEEEALLRETDVNVYDEIINTNLLTRAYRPTLYDFLAHRALDFLSNEEASLTRPSYQFKITGEEVFGDPESFIKIEFDGRDSLSQHYHALQIMQKLLGMHIRDEDPEAWIDADLRRLRFVHSYSVLGHKDSLFVAALERLEKRTKDWEFSTWANFELASFFAAKGEAFDGNPNPDPKNFRSMAKKVCERAIQRYPKSKGAFNCKELIKRLEFEHLNLQTENISYPGQPSRGLLSYRNLEKTWVRAIRVSKKDLDKLESLEWEKRGPYLAGLQPVQSWELELPKDPDLNQHSVEIKIPALEMGQYMLLLSPKADFYKSKKVLAYSSLYVSEMAYASRKISNRDQEFFVTNRLSGKPLSGVRATAYTQEWNYSSRTYERKKYKSFTTDANGSFTINAPGGSNSKSFFIEFVNGQDRLYTDDSWYLYRGYNGGEQRSTRIIFFSDRSIYRPGQTVFFKGLVLSSYKQDNQIKTGYSTQVRMMDANYQEVSKLKLTSNEYGTFSGSFTIPLGGLNGQFTLRDEGGHGYHSFRVEEYKRPKFEVNFEPVKGSFRLNETVKVTGKAAAYAGSNIDGAKVQFRVVRGVRYPYWRWWYWSMPQSNETEIVNGVAETDEEGKFEVEFTALPDLSIAPGKKPEFYYRVIADVTDITGETHSSEQSVKVGYVALAIDVALNSPVNGEQRPVFAINSKNLNGEKEDSKGSMNVWKLKDPGRTFRNRLWTRPDKFMMQKEEFYKLFPLDVYDREDDFRTWEKGEKVFTVNFDTKSDDSLRIKNLKRWAQGRYVLEIKTQDAFGQKIENEQYFEVQQPSASEISRNATYMYLPQKINCEPGEEAKFTIGTSEKKIHVLYMIEHQGKELLREWIEIPKGKKEFSIPVKEEHRGGLGFYLLSVKNGRVNMASNTVSVPWTNKKLNIEYETFRDKLLPGQKEQWKVKISGPDGEKVGAEMVASMYDASLDALVGHNWSLALDPYYSNQSWWEGNSAFSAVSTALLQENWNQSSSYYAKAYDQINWFNFQMYRVFNYYRINSRAGGLFAESEEVEDMDEMVVAGNTAIEGDRMLDAPPAAPKEQSKSSGEYKLEDSMNAFAAVTGKKDKDQRGLEGQDGKSLGDVKIRTNLNETAFFYPHLETNEKGEIIIAFTVPEALTRWRILGLAHSKDLKVGMVDKSLVTQKDLMVMPNSPRFFREGDKLFYTAKVSNLSKKDLSGTAELEILDALTMKNVDAKFGNGSSNRKSFAVKQGRSAPLVWEINIPEGIQAVAVRTKAKAGNFTDGEENVLPVLTNRMLVTESMPLPLRPGQKRKFSFTKLKNNKSSTLRHHKYTLEFTSNPAWYAVQSLPYLMEYPYECTEQVFSRYYANSLASHVANSHPRIKAVFDTWKNTDKEALLSNLEKNQELKYLLLEETPWVVNAQSESERKKRVGLLFDLNHMGNQLSSALNKLLKVQASNGGFPWFKGGKDDRYITQHVVAGFGHLDRLGVTSVKQNSRVANMIRKAVSYLDERIREDYERLVKSKVDMEKNYLSHTAIHYLYTRSFFKGQAMNNRNKKAFDYYLGQARKYWLKNNNYSQGMIALALHRYDDKEVPNQIIDSIREHANNDEELGMYWKNVSGWYWYQAPIETQALLIEAFDEVADDQTSVEEMKLWLLKQKQTQDWKTTKATAEACYALLLRGTDLLAESSLAEITIGGEKVDPGSNPDLKVEAGTGYFKTSWSGSQITSKMSEVEVNNPNKVAAWGSVYWQYFEQLDKITPHETPLKLKKQLFLQENSDYGPKIRPVDANTKLEPGDLLKVRIELRVDRAMEYVHMKDMRASGFEPVNVLSSYKWQDGLGYYESTRDAATNFFFSWLPKGTYVFEYPLRVNHRGDFSNGITTIQCMYAPEFTSHSEGIRVEVK